MTLIEPHQARALLDDRPEGLVVLDVRTPDEFHAGHIHGAVLVDFYGDDFVERIQQLDRQVPYLVVCHSGGRSARTAQLMDQLGFAPVADLAGGMAAWSEAGLPVER